MKVKEYVSEKSFFLRDKEKVQEQEPKPKSLKTKVTKKKEDKV